MNKIIPVILAGGVGTRLWPLSTTNKPKQFQLLGGYLSLFQQSIERVLDLSCCHAPWVVGSQQHRFMIADQLQKTGCHTAQVILEPTGKTPLQPSQLQHLL